MYRSTQSLDQVQTLGRWACAKTCKAYIDEALVERSMIELSPKGKEFLERAVSAYPAAMRPGA